jgi:SagB-type dehydrogenase family enzyme
VRPHRTFPIGELRPLTAGPHRVVEDGAVVIAAADRDVRVEGDAELVEAVLSRCDGRRTVGEIAAQVAPGSADEVTELVGLLAARGAVVDCSQAYRLAHAAGAAGSPLLRDVDDAALAALMAERYVPEGDLGAPLPLERGTGALLELARRRASTGSGDPPRPVSPFELGAVLEAMYGGATRPVPSAGALYPLIVHVLIRVALGPFEAGLWWYDPGEDALRRMPGEASADGLLAGHPDTDPIVAADQPIVFISADLERASRKYSSRGYRFALMEAGAAMQNAQLVGTELGVPVRAIGGVIDDVLHARLALPPEAAPLLAILLGR